MSDVNAAGPDEFEFWIDPGDATPEVVAEVLTALSELYRSHGGSGFVFRTEGDVTVMAAAPAEATV